MKRVRIPRNLGIALFILWLFAVYAAFYLIQKPFSPQNAAALARAGLDGAVALLIVGLGAALGQRILVWLGLVDLPPGDVVWLAPALGLGGIGLLSLGLGLAGGWRRPLVYGLSLAGLGLLARDGLALARRLARWRPSLPIGRWERWYLALTLTWTVLLALAPPTSWDGLFYHLTGPSLYIAQGQISALDINIPHLAFPSLMEMLFGLAMLLRSDGAAKLLHLAYGLLLAALVYRMSKRWQGREQARWSLLLLTAMPMVAVLAAWAYNDLALAFYQVAALYALLAWRETERRGWLIAGGILSGLALGLKYTAFPLPLVGLVYLLRDLEIAATSQGEPRDDVQGERPRPPQVRDLEIAATSRGEPRDDVQGERPRSPQVRDLEIVATSRGEPRDDVQGERSRPPQVRDLEIVATSRGEDIHRRRPSCLGQALIFAALTGVVALPWYLRNWAFTGNPVYPFLLHGRNWDAFRAAWYAHLGTGIGWRPLDILALPVTMTLGLRDVNYFDGRMGPLFLALAPTLIALVALRWRCKRARGEQRKHAPPRSLLLLGGFAAVHALAWTLGVIQSRALFQSRLFLPGFVALIPLFSETLVRLSLWDSRKFSLSSFTHLLVGVTLALTLVDQTINLLRFNPFQYLVGYESRSAYLERVLGDHYRAMEQLEEVVPEDGRVLFLWEPRSYYSPRPTQPDAILDNWSHLLYLYGTDTDRASGEDHVAAHLRAEGFTHVLLYKWGLDFVVEHGESPLPPEDVRRLQKFIDRHLALERTIGRYRLYRLEGN